MKIQFLARPPLFAEVKISLVERDSLDEHIFENKRGTNFVRAFGPSERSNSFRSDVLAESCCKCICATGIALCVRGLNRKVHRGFKASTG